MVFLLTTGMTVLLAYLLSTTFGGNVSIYVTSDDSSISRAVIGKLENMEGIDVLEIPRNELSSTIDEQMIVIEIKESSFSILSGSMTQQAQHVAVILPGIYSEARLQHRIIEIGGEEKWKQVEEEMQEEEAFVFSKEAMNEKQEFRYDAPLQTLFGYMLFLFFIPSLQMFSLS